MILYPDQNGQPQDTMTFTAPQQQTDESAYEQLSAWLCRKVFRNGWTRTGS